MNSRGVAVATATGSRRRDRSRDARGGNAAACDDCAFDAGRIRSARAGDCSDDTCDETERRMMMLSPMLISAPFKILLFVLVDGWVLVVGSLAASFNPF